MDLPPLDQFTELFTERYNAEDRFRNLVHNYLGISRRKKVSLGFKRKFMKKSYERAVDDLIETYAVKVYKDAEKQKEISDTVVEAKKTLQEAKDLEEKIRASEQQAQQAEETGMQILNEYEGVASAEVAAYEENLAEVYKTAEQARIEIIQKTDVDRIAKEHLKKFISSSSLLVAGDGGKLEFDEKRIVEVLEDRFLDEILEDIAANGTKGFMSKVQSVYDGLTSHWDVIEDLSEIPEIDWIGTIIYSRTKGFRHPQYPYFITGKPGERKVGKAQVNSAIALDMSGSMEGKKILAASKTTLALRSLMRCLNPDNNTYNSVYNDKLYEVASADMIRGITAVGNTYTHLALNWQIEMLKDTGGLAYLITDGLPNFPDEAVKSAEKFRDYPIALRIFLIGNERGVFEHIKALGNAAGPDTRVVNVDYKKLGSSVISDIADAIGTMQSIAEFAGA